MSAAPVYLARCDECGERVPLHVGDLAVHVDPECMDDTKCNGPLVLLGPAVWVLVTHAPDGVEVTVHDSEDAARRALRDYCRDRTDATYGLPEDTVCHGWVDGYYNERTEEHYDLTPMLVQS